MEWLILAVVIIAGVAHVGYLERHRIRSWWQADMVNKNAPPHQRWPEILQWREGDQFSGYPYHCRSLVSITSDGYAVIEWLGQREYVHVSRLIGHNADARTRRINRDLQQSDEYMQLLKAFNESVAELEKRDEKLKLVS